jgi:hypothetical protein
MIAIPVTMDQPGVAARIMWTDTGKTIPVTQLTIERLRFAIEEVLTNPGYRANAQRFQRLIAANHGVARAAELIEGALIGHSYPCILELADSLMPTNSHSLVAANGSLHDPHAIPPCERGNNFSPQTSSRHSERH